MKGNRLLILETPIGPLAVLSDGTAVTALYTSGHRHFAAASASAQRQMDKVLTQAQAQLDEYFAGRRRIFDLPLAPAGTVFDRQVWNQLRAIPFGATCSYAELATAIGRPQAARASGTANGRNPISILIPCHRVVRTNGELSGYAGGQATKRWLLEHERRIAGESLPGQRPLPGLFELCDRL